MRDAQFSGAAAAEWFQERSMHARKLSNTNMVVVNEIRMGAFSARRFWSNARSFNWRGPVVDGMVLITYLVEGRGTADDKEIIPGAIVVLESGTSSNLEFQTPFAVAQLVTTRRRISTGGLPAAPDAAWIGRSSFGNFFLTSHMALFDPSVRRTDFAFPHARRSVELAFTAALSSATGRTPAGTTAERHLFSQATRIIHAESHSTALTVGSLVTRLSTSKSHLHRAFAASGTTPSRYLREIRARNARSVLSEQSTTGSSEAEAIALEMGFSSARAMWAALARVYRDDNETSTDPDGISR